MTDEMQAFLIVAGLTVFFLLLPCRYDPAIIWKEKQERWPKRKQSRPSKESGFKEVDDE